ncbi:unnamed protein product [Ranitomeya imitator]|uniref:Immediate early response 3-interacting protein 1 n=1 Tax=Ranitomeya imitator TaxID=111125 RepID=A0ABN9KX85_9NEOB|nr:unnamed protein product [Ranitomeya imitator]
MEPGERQVQILAFSNRIHVFAMVNVTDLYPSSLRPLLMHPMILFALAAAAWHWLLQFDPSQLIPALPTSRRHVTPRESTNKMAFTLYSLLQAALLCVNAVAVLHEERFLSKIGWGADQGIGGFGEEPGVKSQMMNLVRSVRTVMRVSAAFTVYGSDVQPVALLQQTCDP